MDLELENKVALVTASSDGIGFAIAKILAEEGATVYINGRSEASVNKAIEKIGRGKLKPAAYNLSDKKGVDSLIKAVPKVDILVNNLGIYEVKPFEQISDDEWYKFFEINVMSGIRLSRFYFPKMKADNWGRIIFISSESGIQIPSEMIHYGMTKTAQMAVGRGLAELSAGTNVTVNSVLPGPTASVGVQEFVKQMAKEKNISPSQVEEDFFKNVRPSSLTKRFAETEEVGHIVAFLCSPKAAYINGTAIRAEGGIVRSVF